MAAAYTAAWNAHDLPAVLAGFAPDAVVRERRGAVMADYDADAATYDDSPYPTTPHTTFIDRLLASCPPDGIVLDAPCGTGQYFARVRDAGRRVVGIDQSAGMLDQARRRGLAERVERLGLGLGLRRPRKQEQCRNEDDSRCHLSWVPVDAAFLRSLCENVHKRHRSDAIGR